TLVLQIGDRKVKYFLDGRLLTTHGEPYYPEAPMSINFNLWFIVDGLLDSAARRSYQEDIDWVFHEAGRTLSPAEVLQTVADLRTAGTTFLDDVPALNPPLPSPCDL